MDNFTLTALGIGFIFLSSTLGAALVYCFKGELSKKTNAAFLGLASGIMLAASIWSLLLPALEQAGNGWGRYAIIPVSVGFLLGAAFLWLFDKMTPDTRKKALLSEEKKAKRLFLAVTLHNIPESLAVGFAFGAAWAIGTQAAFLSALGVAIGIGIQNFPEGAAVSLPMRTALRSKNKAFLYGLASGAVEPVFAVFGCIFAVYLRVLQPWLLAFAAGAMVFVVAQDLLPDSLVEEGEARSSLGAWATAFGFVLMMILDVALS
ncbi:MAG: ZIP family metal transporter [Clostridia bacterium]|nr:ZIP family metal transporter [Clostridia bacterium]